MDTLKHYMVGSGIQHYKHNDEELACDKLSAFFPMFLPRKESNILSRVKIRAIYKQNKHLMKTKPVGGSWGFFGLNQVPNDSKFIIITEGEYDAMAVWQATGHPAVSLPNGASHLPTQLLPWLENFKRIYLWMDNDLAGQEASEKFAKKLGTKRVMIVKPEGEDAPKDANDALLQNHDLTKYIADAKPIGDKNIIAFKDLREKVYLNILKDKEESGIMSQTMDWYNSKTKGFRRGELTVLTGPTGSGKTTLLSQLSLELCRTGVPTIWGSFEIKNEILLKKLLMQYAKVDLTEHPELFNEFADQFEDLPLYLLKFFGSSDIDQILDTIDFSVYAYDVAHIVVDNLQFMISGQAQGFQKFDLQDSVIAKLRQFATEKNVHITLVIHPKKVDDDSDLNISSVFGSAKATQEADNIFVLQNRQRYRLVDVRKNRYDGELGRAGLGFDKKTLSFFELTAAELSELRHNQELTMEDVLNMRNVEV